MAKSFQTAGAECTCHPDAKVPDPLCDVVSSTYSMSSEFNRMQQATSRLAAVWSEMYSRLEPFMLPARPAQADVEPDIIAPERSCVANAISTHTVEINALASSIEYACSRLDG